MAEDGSKRLQWIAPKGKPLRADACARSVTAEKTFHQTLRALQRLALGLFAHASGQLLVVRHSHAAAIGVDALEHLEAEKGRRTERSHKTTAITRARCLSAIFHDDEVMLFGNLHNLIHLARMAVEMRRHDCARAFRYGCFYL